MNPPKVKLGMDPVILRFFSVFAVLSVFFSLLWLATSNDYVGLLTGINLLAFGLVSYGWVGQAERDHMNTWLPTIIATVSTCLGFVRIILFFW